MRRRRKRSRWLFLWIAIPILVVAILFALSAPHLFDLNLYRTILEKSLTAQLGREVIIGRATISLWDGIGIAFEDVRVRDRSRSFDLLQSKRMILRAKILPLLHRELKWKRVVLDQPTLALVRTREGTFNLFDGPLTARGIRVSQQRILQVLSTFFGGSLTLRDGKVSFSDEGLGESTQVTEIGALNLQVSEVLYGKPFPFRLAFKVARRNQEAAFTVLGKIQDLHEDMDLSKVKIDAEIEVKGIHTAQVWPYLRPWLPMKRFEATLDLSGRYQGNFGGPFKVSTRMRFKEVLFDYPQVFAYVVTPKWMNLDLEVGYDSRNLTVPRISLELPEISVKAKGRIYALGTKDMGMDAEAESSPFDLADGKRLIPYRIITPEVSERLFKSEGSGPVQILSVKLAGKMPEVEHCDEMENAHVLSVEMKLDRARVKFPWDLPEWEDLRGHLLFKDGHLQLKDVEGRFLHSSFEKTSGTLYQLLHVPLLQVESDGTFDLTDLPAILRLEAFPRDATRFFSRLKILSGTAGFRQSLRGPLKSPLQLEHRGEYQLSKVRLVHSEIPLPVLIGQGRAALSNDGGRFFETSVSIGHSSLAVESSWKWGKGEDPFEITTRGRIDLRDLLVLSQARVLPDAIRMKMKSLEALSGSANVSFKGKVTSPRFSYEATLAPQEASLRLKGIPSSFRVREGVLSLSPSGLSVTRLRVVSGNSALTVEGSLTDDGVNLSTWGTLDLKSVHDLLQSPLLSGQIRTDGIQDVAGMAEVRARWVGKDRDWMASLQEGEFRVKGGSLQDRRLPVPLTNVEGLLTFSQDRFQLSGVKASFGDSSLFISSAVIPRASSESGEPPEKKQISFQLTSPHLSLDPFFPKKERETPVTFQALRHWLSTWSVEGHVEIAQGSYKGFPFGGLKLGIKTVDERLVLQPLQFEALGGDVWGEAWIEPAERGIRFEMKPRLSNMEAKSFLRAILWKGKEDETVISGRVHVSKVELRGEGDQFSEIKETLNGSFKFELESGAIERANILSKIFSLLNITQYFKGRLPDLKTRGLPFYRILADVHVENGVASTDDLLVDSEAMRITAFGKVDLVRNLIDARIGVHPLITVDAVLSSVPVAGYILTGKDKAFVSFVYAVSGSLDHPKIEAIPVRSLGERFLGIIQRILETPVRPFQKPSSSAQSNK